MVFHHVVCCVVELKLCSYKTNQISKVSEIQVKVGEQVTTSTTKIAKQFNVCDNLAVEIPPADKEPKNDLKWTKNTFN